MRFFRRARGSDELPLSVDSVSAAEPSHAEADLADAAERGPEADAKLDDAEDDLADAAERGPEAGLVDAEADVADAEARLDDAEAEPDNANAEAKLEDVEAEKVVEPVRDGEPGEPGVDAVALSGLEHVQAEMAESDPDIAPEDLSMGDVASADALAQAEAEADALAWLAVIDDAREESDAADAAPAADEAANDDGVSSTEGTPVGRPRRSVGLWPGPDLDAVDDTTSDGRAPALRFAALHLRGGQHALARAELEALAGRGRLDELALLDLAEIRWRTGDLAGAGDAANALLARGSEAPLALVIAAEAVAAVGRPGEARRLSSRALEVADGPLDALFAGMPRSAFWPAAPESEAAAEAPRRRGRNRAGDTSGAPSTASEAFAGGRAALARGDTTRAALLLGVAMRLAPQFAEDVLHAVTGRDDQPLLALVKGDALRLLGRETEALDAFDRARGRASATASGMPGAGVGPGLFDDDPAISGDDEA